MNRLEVRSLLVSLYLNLAAIGTLALLVFGLVIPYMISYDDDLIVGGGVILLILSGLAAIFCIFRIGGIIMDFIDKQ